MSDTKINSSISSDVMDRAELERKSREIYEHKTNIQYEKFKEQERRYEKTQQIDLTETSEEVVNKLRRENIDYQEQAKNSKVFINNSFKGMVPYFARNLILIAGVSGHGKSTTSANLGYHAYVQDQKILMIVNEEHPTDVYNRITCLGKGWAYVDHSSFTEEQIKAFDEGIVSLSKKIYVAHDSMNGEPGQTTTFEGIKRILDEALRVQDTHPYDVIIIDYYQNISQSLEGERRPWEVQENFVRYIDNFKLNYNAPIILLAQLRPGDESKLPFKEAIEGRKSILNVATCAIKIEAERDLARTSFEFKKCRFNDSVGKTVYTGFSKGKYIPYTDEFKNNTELNKERKTQAELLKRIKVTNGLESE